MKRPLAFGVAIGLGLGASGLAGCGGGGHPSVSNPGPPRSAVHPPSAGPHHARHRPRRRPVSRPRPAKGPPVGRAQTVHAGDAILRVTVTRVYDPLPGGEASPLPGSRPVAVTLTIVNTHGETYDSTASGDAGLVLSHGQAQPLFIRAGICQTPLTDFDSLIGVGETRSGCVGFSVPRGARVSGVRFSPHSRAPDTVTWRVG